jgi:hypothetical protein
METEGSLSQSRKPSTSPYPKQKQSVHTTPSFLSKIIVNPLEIRKSTS